MSTLVDERCAQPVRPHQVPGWVAEIIQDDAALAQAVWLPQDAATAADVTAVTRAPRLCARLHRRARRAMRAGRDDFALVCLLRAVQFDSSHAGCFRLLAEIWQRKQRYTEALAAHIRVIRLVPDDPEGYLALARALGHQGLFGDAAALCQRALALDPQCAAIHLELGDAVLAKLRAANLLRRDVEQVVVHYERARQLDPQSGEPYRRLARVWAECEDAREAIEILQAGQQLLPRCVDLYVDEGELLMQACDFDSARDPLRVALHCDPQHVQACRLYVQTLDQLHLDRVEVQDDLVEALCGLGAALERPGPEQHLAEAFETYHDAVKIRPDCLRALLKLGDLALRLGQPQQAVQYFDAALQVDPDLGRMWD